MRTAPKDGRSFTCVCLIGNRATHHDAKWQAGIGRWVFRPAIDVAPQLWLDTNEEPPPLPKPATDKELGQALVNLLDLQTNDDARYPTLWGAKNLVGLGGALRHLVKDPDSANLDPS